MNFSALFQSIFLGLMPMVVPQTALPPVPTPQPAPQAIHAALVQPQAKLSGDSALPVASARVVPQKNKVRDLGVKVTAKSAVVVDRGSRAILFSKAGDKVQSIASLSKLLTALVVTDMQPDWDRRIILQANDLRGGGVEYLSPGEEVSVHDLLMLSLVTSSNTATAALARATGLSADEFAKHMNDKAAQIGMESAHFEEPTGLDEGNRASAKDVARLAAAAFAVPEIANAVTSLSYTVTPTRTIGAPTRTVKSTDVLLGSALNTGQYRVSGGKTGTLGDVTGYHLAIAVKDDEAKHDVIVVVLGSSSLPTRFTDAKALAYWSFGAYTWEQ